VAEKPNTDRDRARTQADLHMSVVDLLPIMPASATRPQKNTFGEMRSNGGPTGILIYSGLSVQPFNGDVGRLLVCAVRLSDIEPRFVCSTCGKRGAGMRPHFAPAHMGSQ
jgi:hypothetical protein